MKKLSLLISVLMLAICICPQALNLNGAETDGEGVAFLAGSTFEGSGTKDSPYIIADADDFIAFSKEMAGGNKFSGNYFKQTADIDLADRADYTGITMSSNVQFYGVYDGNGHTLNVKLSGENLCIFSYVYGTIMNLGTTGSVTNTAASGTKYATGISRSIQAGAKLINCYSTATLTGGQVAGLSTSIYGTANNCYFAGTLAGSANNRAICTAVKDTSSFTNCFYTTGSIGDAVATSVTDAEAKSNLADTLNEGRESAAAAAGVSVEKIYRWTNENGYPEHYVYVDNGITGSGSATDPYVINSSSDFIIFTNALNRGETYNDKYFVQECDIDLAGNADYLGCIKSANFYGTYDGKGNTINIALTASDERNIFPYVYGKLINVGTTGSLNVTATGGIYSCGIARSIRNGAVLANSYSTLNITSGGDAVGICASGNGLLSNCYFAGTLSGKNKYAIAASVSGGAFENCYYTVGKVATGVTAALITEETAKTTLAATLNDGRAAAAEAAGVEKTSISMWTNENGFVKHFVPKYAFVEPEISAPYIEAGKADTSVISADADYIGRWEVDLGGTDVTYTASEDNKTLTITPGKLAGVVTVRAYAAEDILISEDYTVVIHSSKEGKPGINMLNGLDKAVDFEDGFAYGVADVRDNALSAGNTPTVDYSASTDENGNAATALKNNSAKALIADASSVNKGDAWYYVFKTAVSGLEPDRAYSAYAQIYTDSSVSYKSLAWFNNFKETDGEASMTITYNGINNTWREYKYSGTYTKNSTAAPAFNTKQESLNGENDSTITVAAIDNMYIIPHYNITYHYPDGTTEKVSFNPVESEYPLTLAKTYNPDKSYQPGNYLDSETGKYCYYSGLWAVSENGEGYVSIPLENEDIHLYPEKLTDGIAVFYVDSLEAETIAFNENVTVTDTYNAANINGNGTTNLTIEGKGYNGSLEVKNGNGETLAYVYLTGTHKWRPGLNIFTGTPDAHDIETDALFNASSNAVIVENPLIDSENETPRVYKILSNKAYSSINMDIEQPIEWARPFRIDYDYMGKLNGAFWNMMNTSDASGILSTNASVSSDKWSHLSQVLCAQGKVSEASFPALTKLIINTTGKAGDDSYAMYIDNFSIIPSYKVEFFDEKGNKIDKTFYYPRRVETADYFFATTYTVDFNPNANYLVNGEAVETNGNYTLKYEDLKITVLPNSNAVMFSGDNATTAIPEGDSYVIPYPHELPGFTAEDFITWEDKDGNAINPGTVVKTSDVAGTTLYARCDASAFTRKPVNGAVVNFASEQYNNWLANYQISSMIARSDGSYEKEKGVVFEWTEEENAASYTVLYSRNKDMSEAVSIETTETTATAYTLFAATDYYWQIRTVYEDNSEKLSEVWKFTTADIHRILPVINNFRDAGGRLTEDGKYRMKQGIIYRGRAVSSGNRATTDKYGIVADLDLRGAETGWITESPLGSDIIFTIIEGTHYYHTEASVKHYANATGQARFADEIRFFTDPSHYPMYFHCAGGRDRTGMLAYIIGGICGVPEEDLFRDYELTWLSENTCGTDEAIQLSVTWMRGFTAYINKNFEGDTFKEKMEGYVRLCGVTDEEMDAIRAILLEEVKPEQYTETRITKQQSGVRCDVSMTSIPQSSVLCVAGYYDGRLVFDENRAVTKDSETFEITDTVDEIKVFVFENTESLKPLTECEKIAVE